MMTNMKKPASTQEILDMLEVLLNEDQGSLSIESVLADISGWDSMGKLMLMAELDERFGITLRENELAQLQSIQNIIDAIDTNGLLAG